MIKYMKGGTKLLVFLVYLIVGIYLVNLQFQFMKLPATFANFNILISAIGGVLLIIASIKVLLTSDRSFGYGQYPTRR